MAATASHTRKQPLDERRMADLQEIGLHGYAPYLMNRIMGRYNGNLRSEIQAHGLTTAKMRVLAVLAVEDQLSIGDLAVYAVVEQSTLSRALDGLQSDGLLYRETDAVDNRSSRIRLTKAGRTAFKSIWPHMQAEHDAMFNGIDSQERAAFVGTLHKVLANVRHNKI